MKFKNRQNVFMVYIRSRVVEGVLTAEEHESSGAQKLFSYLDLGGGYTCKNHPAVHLRFV